MAGAESGESMNRGGRIGIWLACALGILLAAPSRGADLMPLAMSLTDARGALANARMLVVERLGDEADAANIPPLAWDQPYAVARRDTVSAEWATRFKRLILSAGQYSEFGRCPSLDSLGHSMPARFRVMLVGRSESVWIRFRSGLPCAQFGTTRRPGGSLELRDVTDSLFAMLREATGADAPVGSAADSIVGGHVPRYAAGHDQRPDASGNMVFVDALPEAIEKVPPQYPTQARIDGVSGTVMVIALIGTQGLVIDAFVQDSIPELDRAAMEAVRQWRFKPASTGGKPLAVWVAIPVKFTLH
jgi:TonB family protein